MEWVLVATDGSDAAKEAASEDVEFMGGGPRSGAAARLLPQAAAHCLGRGARIPS